jgi:MFS family permease
MLEDLGMEDIQYNIVYVNNDYVARILGLTSKHSVSIFFIPYILLEVPSNIVLKKFKRPSTYLGILVVSWGIVMIFTGIVKNFAGLMVTRVLLGIAEAGFFPGAVYLITRW